MGSCPWTAGACDLATKGNIPGLRVRIRVQRVQRAYGYWLDRQCDSYQGRSKWQDKGQGNLASQPHTPGKSTLDT